MLELEKIKEQLTSLSVLGTAILHASQWHENRQAYDEKTKAYMKAVADKIPDFKKEYHVWYSKAQRVVSTLASERLNEFDTYFTGNKNIKLAKDFSYLSAGITHYLQGIITTSGYGEEKNYFGKFTSGLQQQLYIIDALKANLTDVLFNLQSEIQFGIFNSELEVASELKKSKLLRPAGAIAGVVIEAHLKAVLLKRGVTLKKKNATMSDFNEELKAQKIIDVAMWRLIQRCGDIRNYCVHPKEREPTSDEIDDIIRSAQKIVAETT
jgi:uncharacterized protein (UPF0332 family)